MTVQHETPRRRFLSQLSLILLGTGGLSANDARKKILLRSSWQTVNIGDIAHTPGVLHLIEEHMPEAEVTLWPSDLRNGVEEMLLRRFPKLKIAKRGSVELKTAFEECDFLLHGSGPSLVAQRDVNTWREETGKPYGVYGITFARKQSHRADTSSDEAINATVEVLSGAEFVFFRDTKSMALAKSLGCSCPVMEFGPDGAFACDVKNDEKAEAFLAANDLEVGKFLCCIPRLRYTPYWLIKDRPKDEVRHARNEDLKFHDHDPHLEAIERVVKETDLKVLLCPEDQTQMRVGKDLLYDRLSPAAKERVVWRENYWLTDEALSTYVRSAGLFGNEMHSPIMCVGQGIPAIVCRWEEQTSKGYMWEDIGLGEWLHHFDDEAEVARLPETVLAMAQDLPAARAKAAKARAFVRQRQEATMDILREKLG